MAAAAASVHRRRRSVRANRVAAGALIALLACAWAAPGAGTGWAATTRVEVVRLDALDRSYPSNEPAQGWRSYAFNPLRGLNDRSGYRFVSPSDPDGPYIRLRSTGRVGFGLAAELPFRLRQHLVLAWEWRVTRLPQGGDVSVRARDDQAGSLCIAVDPGWSGPDSVLCYLWENHGPRGTQGTQGTADGNPTHKSVILRTGEDDRLGAWYGERRHVAADYLRAFGRLPSAPAVVTLTIDTNDTDSEAEAFYRNIRLYTAPAAPTAPPAYSTNR